MAVRPLGAVPLEPPRRLLTVTVDGAETRVPEGATILDACRANAVDTPTLCYADNLTPVNACRVCVVEVEGSRTLVPACSRTAEDGMVVSTDTDRVRHSRTLVMEFLASSVEMDLTNADVHRWMAEYEVHPERFGAQMPELPADERDRRDPGHHHEPLDPTVAEGVAQPVKIDNELYVRDYSRCILCYKCVEACGVDAQNTFAIAVAGRGFDARISTEYAVPLDESACVYCGNCIGVCPTGALMFRSEHEMREDGSWDEQQQTVTNTICPYCGVGCELELHVQDNEIVKVTSPWDHSVTNGHLCIKGRFGFAYVQSRREDDPTRRRAGARDRRGSSESASD
ncbi:MAG TPA: 2Fe-2S iron-sulfur cluster-binding protein [Actinomycetota bacterium]|nr:2Fe-2S iron-sulfur cluster-binding protein [Actinomycetota bacterium]